MRLSWLTKYQLRYLLLENINSVSDKLQIMRRAEMPIANKFSYLMFYNFPKTLLLLMNCTCWLQSILNLYILFEVITKLNMLLLPAPALDDWNSSSKLLTKLTTTSLSLNLTCCRCRWSISARSQHWWTTSSDICYRWKLNQTSWTALARSRLSIYNISPRTVFQKLGSRFSCMAISCWPLSMLFISESYISASCSASLKKVNPVENTSHFSGSKSPVPDLL